MQFGADIFGKKAKNKKKQLITTKQVDYEKKKKNGKQTPRFLKTHLFISTVGLNIGFH